MNLYKRMCMCVLTLFALAVGQVHAQESPGTNKLADVCGCPRAGVPPVPTPTPTPVPTPTVTEYTSSDDVFEEYYENISKASGPIYISVMGETITPGAPIGYISSGIRPEYGLSVGTINVCYETGNISAADYGIYSGMYNDYDSAIIRTGPSKGTLIGIEDWSWDDKGTWIGECNYMPVPGTYILKAHYADNDDASHCYMDNIGTPSMVWLLGEGMGGNDGSFESSALVNVIDLVIEGESGCLVFTEYESEVTATAKVTPENIPGIVGYRWHAFGDARIVSTDPVTNEKTYSIYYPSMDESPDPSLTQIKVTGVAGGSVSCLLYFYEYPDLDHSDPESAEARILTENGSSDIYGVSVESNIGYEKIVVAEGDVLKIYTDGYTHSSIVPLQRVLHHIHRQYEPAEGEPNLVEFQYHSSYSRRASKAPFTLPAEDVRNFYGDDQYSPEPYYSSYGVVLSQPWENSVEFNDDWDFVDSSGRFNSRKTTGELERRYVTFGGDEIKISAKIGDVDSSVTYKGTSKNSPHWM